MIAASRTRTAISGAVCVPRLASWVRIARALRRCGSIGHAACRAAPIVVLALFCVGCAPLEKTGSGVRLDGVARVEVEDFRVLLSHNPNSAVLLLSGGRPTDELDLRIGDEFALGQPGGVPVAYQLLAISGDSASLRRELLIDQRAAGLGIRRETSVVRVRSYRPD